MANLFSIPSPNSINMANFVTIKLSAESYIAWREQVTGMAGLFHISGFLTGQTPPPQQYKPKPPNTDATTINAADDTHSSATHTDEQEETDEYVAWKQTDLFLRSLLIGTMSPEVLTLATGHSTTKDLWYALEQEFARSSYQRSFTLLQQVRNLKKDNSTSVSDHVRQFKALSDKLAIIGKPLDDDDKVQYLLMSLPSSYKDFVTMMMKPPAPTYTECVSQLVSYEDRCLLFDSSTDGTYAFATHTANNNSHNGGEKPRFTSQGKGFRPATEQPNTSNVSSSFDLNALARLLQKVSNTGQFSNQSSGSNYRP